MPVDTNGGRPDQQLEPMDLELPENHQYHGGDKLTTGPGPALFLHPADDVDAGYDHPPPTLDVDNDDRDAAEQQGYHSDEDECLEQACSDQAYLRLLQWKRQASVSTAMYESLRTLLRQEFTVGLPSLYMLEKKLEKHCPEASTLTTELVHACPKGCILYTGDNQSESSCPVCQEPRYEGEGKSRKQTGSFIGNRTTQGDFGGPGQSACHGAVHGLLRDQKRLFAAA